MKKLWMLLLIWSSVIYADAQEDKVCKEAKDKFEQVDYLVNNFKEYSGAFAIFSRSNVAYSFKNTKIQYKCLNKYKDRWLYLLHKNNKLYLLEKLYRTDKTNYLLPLYIGHLARKNNNTQKALDNYNKYITLKKDHLDKDVLKYIKSGGLIQHKSRWAKRLNGKSKIPREKFKNIFFDLKDKTVFKTTQTKELNLQSHFKLYGHNTADIGSYHVGNFYIDKDTTYNISLRTGNARACRVIVDNMILSNKTRFKKKHSFKKGLHKIEIEFLNRNSSYDLNFDMSVYVERHDDKFLKNLLNNQEFELMLVNYQPSYKGSHQGGGLEIKKETKSPEVTIKKSKKPVVLILQSTAKVNWKLKNTKNLKAVIVGKHSTLTDTLATDTKFDAIYHSKSNFRAKGQVLKNCRCIGAGGIYLCDTTFLSTYGKLKKLLGKSLDGYTYTSKEQFSVPQESVDANAIKMLNSKIELDKKACKERQIDKVFNY